jgi:ribosomal protein S18 acetylase RimI-like enzyme
VRPARAGDDAAVSALWAALLGEHAARDPAFALRPGTGTGAGLLAVVEALSRDPAAALWVWDGAAGVAGFCAARRQEAPAAAAERRRVEITEIAVAPAARRRGIGTALAQAALDWAAACCAERIEVRVSAHNAAGQAFWRALGFADFVNVLDRRL